MQDSCLRVVQTTMPLINNNLTYKPVKPNEDSMPVDIEYSKPVTGKDTKLRSSKPHGNFFKVTKRAKITTWSPIYLATTFSSPNLPSLSTKKTLKTTNNTRAGEHYFRNK